MMMARPEFIEVEKYLGGMRYPATKEQLIAHARSKQADRAALEALQSIPDREYDGPQHVSQAVAHA
jgi:hypothetical protein